MNNLRLLTVLCLSVLLSPALYADDNQEIQSPPPQSMEYVDPSTNVTHTFGDGFGNQISREQFIQNVNNGAKMVEQAATRTQVEARQYLTTASVGEDAEITQGVINSSDQAIKDVRGMSEAAIHQAQNLKPKASVNYEKPKVLVSE